MAHIKPTRPDMDETLASIRSNAQPEAVKLTTSSDGVARVKKLMLRIGGPEDTINVELEIPDARTFLDEVAGVCRWIDGEDD